MNKKKYEFYSNDPVSSIVELLERSEKLYGDSPAVRYKVKKVLVTKSYTDVLSDSKNFAAFLLENYPQAEHIALLGTSSYEWMIGYFATLFAGKVIVPLDKELSSDALAELIGRADADLLLYDSKFAKRAKEISNILNIELLALEDSEKPNNCGRNLPDVIPDKLSTILFTSGTTGKSKGVMLTQNNIACNVIQSLGIIDLYHDKDVILSILPMYHAFEFTCTILCTLYKGVPIYISSGLRYLQRELKEYRPTVMCVVPLFVQTLYKNVEIGIKNAHKEKSFNSAVKLCRFFKKFHIDLSDALFKEIRINFGGRLKKVISGGANLNESLIKKYNDIGINLFQGYGLTECSPLLSANFDYYHRPNSVGKIVAGNEAKTVDGEIWARGLSVSKGYYNNPEETKKAFEDGWFKTGDLGTIDKDGFIFIKGRKKNLIILNNGKNVSAEELENLICEIDSVSEVAVYGEKDKIVAQIYSDTNDKDMILAKIKQINKSLPSYKQIDDVVFRNTPFEKTATKKIKRP